MVPTGAPHRLQMAGNQMPISLHYLKECFDAFRRSFWGIPKLAYKILINWGLFRCAKMSRALIPKNAAPSEPAMRAPQIVLDNGAWTNQFGAER